MADRPSTPPRATRSAGTLPQNPLTPEQVRRMETARLKAKAAAQQAQAQSARPPPQSLAGTKRTHASISSSNTPSQSRDAGKSSSHLDQNGFVPAPADALITAAKNFGRSEYIEYDFSKMTDTKGGFLSMEDDPHNRAMRGAMRRGEDGRQEERPEGMTMGEWERERLRRKMRADGVGRWEKGLSVLDRADFKDEEHEEDEEQDDDAAPQKRKGKYLDNLRDVPGRCRECRSLEIDAKWQDVYHVGVCNACKEKFPDKYSLLTKTEAREDYLLTDPELKDEDLLPHLERPNPHKTAFHNMQLFLRLQVESYALGPQRWGSAEALDEAYEKRKAVAKQRKEKKFNKKLEDLKKRTRVEAYKRARMAGGGGAGGQAQFGDRIKGVVGERHVHEWGRGFVDEQSGVTRKVCVECGMEVEEVEF